MTTLERFRRRQRFEGGLLVVLGLWVAFWTWNSSESDEDIVDCLESKVSELSSSIRSRSGLTEQETEATKKVLLAVPQVKTQEAFAELLGNYRISIEQIQQTREQNPLPPYPEGTCDDKG